MRGGPVPSGYCDCANRPQDAVTSASELDGVRRARLTPVMRALGRVDLVRTLGRMQQGRQRHCDDRPQDRARGVHPRVRPIAGDERGPERTRRVQGGSGERPSEQSAQHDRAPDRERGIRSDDTRARGGVQDHRIRGVAMIAPHFVVEDISVTSIAAIKQAYETANLRSKLKRWHRDVDNAFYGWNAAWLDPKFRDWDISEYLAYIRVPVAILQGAEDEYGTIRQIEIAQEECYCPVDVTIVPGAGHSPHREAPEATLNAISEFAGRILHIHEGSQGRAA